MAVTVERLTPSETRDLAREIITNQALMTSTMHEIESAFSLLLMFGEIPEREAVKIGAIVGRYQDTIPGRGINGYPIFTACRFIHVNDIPYLRKAMGEMLEAQ